MEPSKIIIGVGEKWIEQFILLLSYSALPCAHHPLDINAWRPGSNEKKHFFTQHIIKL